MPGTGDYLIIGAVAALVTFAVTPLVGRFARSRGWLYQPSERTVHILPIPAIGGAAMFAGFIVAFAVVKPLLAKLERHLTEDGVLTDGGLVIGLFYAYLNDHRRDALRPKIDAH